MRRFSPSAFGVACLLVLTGAQSGAAPTFQGLGDLSGGVFDSRVIGISGDGSVVVGWSQTATGREAFRWTVSGGMQGLGTLPGGDSSTAGAASYDGSVIVGRSSIPGGFHAVRWTEAGGMQSIGDLPGGVTQGHAFDVSADGSVVVGWGTSSPYAGAEAFIWTESTGIQALPDGRNAAAISADGLVVVGGTGLSTGGVSATRWTAETGTVALGDLPFDTAPSGTNGTGISADGRVLVGNSSGNGPFSWTEEDGFLFLGNAAGTTNNFVQDASGDGSIIVGSANPVNEATVWNAQNGTRLLKDIISLDFGIDLAGWRLTSAQAISDDGHTMVGIGTNPNGFTEGWIFTAPELPMILAVPEPSAGSLLCLGLFGLGVWKRRLRLG